MICATIDSLPFLLDESCETPKESAVSVRMSKVADGGRPTHKESRGPEEDP